jgi:hypothetical protein
MNWGGAEAAISTGDFPNSLLYLSVTINIRAPRWHVSWEIYQEPLGAMLDLEYKGLS